MKQMRTWIVSFLFVAAIGGSVATISQPTTAYAAKCSNSSRVLGMPAWYRGVVDEGTCEIKSPGDFKDDTGGISSFIWIIALNIIEIVLVIVGYVSVGFIIYGGFKYIVGAGAADQISGAKTTILNAVIGLVISIFSVGIVNIIFAGFGSL